MRGGFLAWLTEGRAICALHDSSMVVSKYKRGRGREIVAKTIAGWTPVPAVLQNALRIAVILTSFALRLAIFDFCLAVYSLD